MALNPLDRLVRDMADVKRQLAGRSQLGHSSLENTAIPVYDGEGQERLRIGAQDDGTHSIKYVQGPPPPRPTAPVVSVDGPVVRVRWDGILMGGHIPEDFARIDVHFALASDDLESPESVRANLATPAGNETVLAATQTGTYRVGLVAMSQSRARSEMSETVEVEVTLVNIEGALDSAVENARGGSNHYKPTPPPGTDHDPDRDLWFDTSEGDDGLTHYTPHRWDPETQEWVSIADQRVDAIQDAQADLEAELDTVRTTADGKNRTFYQSTMPSASTTPAPVLGDLWFNTANGYRLHRHNGTTFIEVADGRIAEIESEVENIDISGPLSEARAEWLADAATDAQAKAQAAAAAAEAAAKLYADAVATGAVEGELEGIQDYADQAADAARQAAIDAAIAEARVIANTARDEALGAALDADAVISQSIAEFENDLDVVRQSADGKNRIVWSPNEPSGDGKSGDTWFRTSGNNIIGHWRHSGSGWVSMSLAPAVIPNLDAGKINSGIIDAERIGAGSITADKLLVGTSENLVSDPQFKQLGTAWSGGTGIEVVEGAGIGGSNVLKLAASGTYIGLHESRAGYRSRVEGGTTYRMAAYLRVSGWTGDPIVAQMYLRFYTPADKAAGSFTWGSTANVSVRAADVVDGEWSLVSFETTAPAGAVEAAPGLYPHSQHAGDVEWCLPTLLPMTGATLIENGAITADKIRAGAVGATAIAAESIDASKIVAGGIQADSLIVPGSVGTTQIKDGAVTTSKIEAGAITAQSGIIASLDAGVIKSGTIDAERIGAASITADKILVGGAGNLLTNPGFTGDGAGWGLGGYDPIITDSGGPTGEPVLSAQRSSGLFLYLGGLVQSVAGSFAPDLAAVEAGKRYSASVWVRADVDIPVGNAGMGFRLRELGSATLGWAYPATATNREVIPANTWAKIEGEFRVPTDTGTWNRLAFGLRANGALNGERVEFSAPVLLPMVGATLIEDDAITTEKIAAGAITAESGIIGSLDLGVATVGELNGGRIEAGTIDTEQLAFGAATGDVLAADAINGKRIHGVDITGSTFRAGDAVEITGAYGLRQYGPDGALNVDFPSDGSPASIRGDFSARRLSAYQLQLTGETTIASGADMVIESGVTAPTAAPRVTPYWDRLTMPPLTSDETAVGLAWGEGHWWRLVTTTVGLSNGGRTRVEKIDTSGELVGTITTTFRVGANGITYLNGELYLLVHSRYLNWDGKAPDRAVVVYNTAGVEQRRWEYPSYGTGFYQPGIGTNGTDIVIAQCWKTGELSYRRYSPTGALVAEHHTSAKVGADMVGFVSGNLDYGSFRTVFAASRASQVGWQFLAYTGTGNNLTYQRADSWTTPGYHAPRGLAWDGEYLWSLGPEGNLVRYAKRAPTWFAGDHGDDWWMAVSWRDHPAESLAGPPGRFEYPHRAQLLITLPDAPKGVTGIAFFVAKGDSEPTRTQLHWENEINQVAPVVLFTALAHNWGTRRPPLAESSFTDSEPSEIRSAIGNFRVDGVGAGEWGPLKFHADGSMSGIPKVAAGLVSIPAADGTSGSPVTVTFPAGLFKSAPAVTLTADSSSARSITATTVRDVTSTSVDIRLLRSGSYNTNVHWIAVERS